MKTSFALALMVAALTTALPAPLPNASVGSSEPASTEVLAPRDAPAPAAPAGFDAGLIPDFGVVAGVNCQANGCEGLDGVLIPKDCPPDRQTFIDLVAKSVAAGNIFGTPTPFPGGTSKAEQEQRLETLIVVQQSTRGVKGSGCPAASTTYLRDRDALLASP